MNYDVFISYSSSTDSQLAKSLQEGLEKLGKPMFKPKVMSVFLDNNDLHASPNLWSSIQVALQKARYLIILASPESAGSRWVEKEIMYWNEQHGADNILIGLTAGNITWDYKNKNIQSSSLSRYTKNIFDTEPLWVDLRSFNKESIYGLDDVEFKKAVSEFSSAILDVRKETLIREDLKKAKNLIRLRNIAIFLLTTLLVLSTALFLISRKTSKELQIETKNRLDKALEANQNNVISSIMLNLDENPRESLKLVELNYQLHIEDWRSANLLFKAFYNEAPLYRKVTGGFSRINSLSMVNDSTWLILTPNKNLYYYNKTAGKTLICTQYKPNNVNSQRNTPWYTPEKPISDSAVHIWSENARAFVFPHSKDIFFHDRERLQMVDSLGNKKATFFLEFMHKEGGGWEIDLSKDERYLLATSTFFGLRLFDTSKKERVGPFMNEFKGGKFSSDGKHLLIPYYNYEEGVSPRLLEINVQDYVRLDWIDLISNTPYQKLKTLMNVRVYRGTKSAITCLKESDNGSLIFAGTELGEIIIWNKSGRIISYSKPHRARIDFLETVNGTDEIVSASRDLSIKVIDLHGNVVQTLRGHKHEINGLQIDSRGKIYSSDTSGAFYQWLRSAPTNIKEYKISTGDFDFDVAADNTIVTINDKGSISIDSSESGLMSKFGYQKGANKIDVDKNNKRLLAYEQKSYWTSEGSEYRQENEIHNVKIWNTRQATNRKLKLDCLQSEYLFLQDSSSVVEVYSDRIEFNHESHGTRILHYPDSLSYLNLQSCSNLVIGQEPSGKMAVLEQDDNTETLITSRYLNFNENVKGNFTTTCSQNSIFIFNNTQGRLFSNETSDANSWNGDIIGHYSKITCALFSKNEEYLLTGSDDGTVRVWNKNNEEIYQYPINSPIRKIMLSDDDKYLYIGSDDGYLRVYIFDPNVMLKTIKDFTQGGYLDELDDSIKIKFGFDLEGN